MTYGAKSAIIKFTANKARYLTEIEEAMLDTRQIHPVSDFVRNPKLHIARIKETRIPEVLTVNGHAEVVVLDTETYERLMERLQTIEDMPKVRAHMQKTASREPREPITKEEQERREAVVREIMAETERLGLYK